MHKALNSISSASHTQSVLGEYVQTTVGISVKEESQRRKYLQLGLKDELEACQKFKQKQDVAGR